MLIFINDVHDLELPPEEELLFWQYFLLPTILETLTNQVTSDMGLNDYDTVQISCRLRINTFAPLKGIIWPGFVVRTVYPVPFLDHSTQTLPTASYHFILLHEVSKHTWNMFIGRLLLFFQLDFYLLEESLKNSLD